MRGRGSVDVNQELKILNNLYCEIENKVGIRWGRDDRLMLDVNQLLKLLCEIKTNKKWGTGGHMGGGNENQELKL